MWRDIEVVVTDLSAKYKRHKIAKMLGLYPWEIHGFLGTRGPYATVMIKRQNNMVDPTDKEIAAIQAASQPAGEYLESIGETDLANLSEENWLTFIEVIVTAYSDKLRALESK